MTPADWEFLQGTALFALAVFLLVVVLDNLVHSTPEDRGRVSPGTLRRLR